MLKCKDIGESMRIQAEMQQFMKENIMDPTCQMIYNQMLLQQQMMQNQLDPMMKPQMNPIMEPQVNPNILTGSLTQKYADKFDSAVDRLTQPLGRRKKAEDIYCHAESNCMNMCAICKKLVDKEPFLPEASLSEVCPGRIGDYCVVCQHGAGGFGEQMFAGNAV